MHRHHFGPIQFGVLVCLLAAPVILRGKDTPWEQLMETGKRALSQGKASEAVTSFTTALHQAEKFGPDDMRVVRSLNQLALAYTSQKRYTQAGPLFERALAIEEKVLGPEDLDIADTWMKIGDFYRVQNRPVDAENAFRHALSIEEQKLGPVDARVGDTLIALAGRLRDQKRWAEAEPMYKQALAIFGKVLAPDSRDLVRGLLGFASFYVAQEKYAEAEPLLKQSAEILERTHAYGTGYPNASSVLERYAAVLRAMNRQPEAAQMESRAKAIRSMHGETSR